MQLYSTIADFYLFYDGPIIVAEPCRQYRNQCIILVTVQERGSIVL